MSSENVLGIEVAPDFATRAWVAAFDTEITCSPTLIENFVPIEHLLTPEEINKLGKGELGDVSYGIVDYSYVNQFNKRIHSKEITAQRFYPFSMFPENTPQLLGKGIADSIQKVVTRILYETYDHDFMVIHWQPSELRENQLNRMGIEKKVWYPLNQYADICLGHTPDKAAVEAV